MEPLSDDNRESVDHIVRAGRHLLDLINEVLDIARIEAGEMSLSVEPIELRDLVRETAALLGPVATEQLVTVHIGTGSAPDVLLMADRQRLKQVLLNLLSNAIKYNKVEGTVDVSWAERDGVVRVEVRDTGLGISEEGKSRVFVPFDRADATHTAVDGTGVGLSLSRSLVEAMGGTLDFTSEVGVGTTFWVDLPSVTASSSPSSSTVDERLDALAAWSAGGNDAEAGTVLYVEDNLANVRVMERLFRTRSDRLEVAMQGSRCLELARQLRPRLILLDLHLPDLSGEDVLRRLKADAATKDIPVVILSADTGARRSDRLVELGAADYLSKPLDLERLLAVLDAPKADEA
jgi:CheY-like chemotaxis protein/two-component sensor histidine kinase